MALLLVIARRVRVGGLASIASPPEATQAPSFFKNCCCSSSSSSRRVLSSSSATPSSSSRAVVAPPFRPVDTRKGVCVVGAGRMGWIRAEGIMSNPGTFLTSVVDPAKEKAIALAESVSAPAFWALEDALTDPLCDAVWVAGPTPLHKECIRMAAEAGKAVAVEKPVATSVEDILECHSVCRANDVPLYCSFQRRTDRTYAELAAAVRGGAVGPVRSVHAVFRDHPVPSIDFLKQSSTAAAATTATPLSRGGDIFHDLAPHDIDFVCFSLGLGEPSEVYATAHSFLPQLEKAGVKDSAHCLFTFPSGAVFTLEMTRCSAYGYDNRIEVMGEHGMLSLGNPPSSGLEIYNSTGCTASPPEYSFPQRFREAYAMEVGEFEQAMRGHSEPPVTCFDSCRTTHIAEQASISARTARPVSISFDGIQRSAGAAAAAATAAATAGL